MNTKTKRAVLAAILLFLVLLVFALVYQNRERETEPISKTDYLLNTIVTVTLYDSQDESILDGARVELMDSMILAFWMCREKKPTRKQQIGY